MKSFRSIYIAFCLSAAFSHATETNSLSLEQARELALKHHPRITAAELSAMAAKENAIEARAAYFPNLTANATAVGTGEDNARIAAGSLSNPGIFERGAVGLVISQLITDFGRTANLTSAAKLRTKAEEEAAANTKTQVILLTDTAYFEGLRAAAVLKVAEQTLATRAVLLDQVSALASNKLKSELDLNFARISVDEARILKLQAESALSAADERLTMLTGLGQNIHFNLQDVGGQTNALPDPSDLVRDALANRPELRQLQFQSESARKFAKAEKAAGYPTLSALGAVGVIPLHDSHFDDEYAVGGINLSVPIFAGGLYSARAMEARYKAEAAEELLKARQEEVIRDVRIAALTVNTAAGRIGVADRMLEHADQAYSLAETKYSFGSASIVELSQAQLSKTLAQIETATARYNYQIQLANLRYQTGAMPPGKREPHDSTQP
jgi:outer membrane protein